MCRLIDCFLHFSFLVLLLKTGNDSDVKKQQQQQHYRSMRYSIVEKILVIENLNLHLKIQTLES